VSPVHEHTVTGPEPIRVRLNVSQGDRTAVGTTIELSATLEDSWQRDLSAGEVVFLDGDIPFATVAPLLDFDVVVAFASYTPTQGVHALSARFSGVPPDNAPTSSAVQLHSVLPTTCADQARPGNGALVRLAYRVVLDRCPDPAGFTYWTDRLDGGVSATVMARGLALSAEGIAATVDAAYRLLLDRPADRFGRTFWAARLRAGWTTSQLWAGLAASPEFVAGAGGAVVDRVFERLVGRPVDEAGRTYWTDRLASGPRSGALRALVLTPEALGRIVDAIHQTALGRTPSDVEQTGLQTTIKARRGDWRTVGADLLGQPAAFAHAQTYPDPAG